MFPNYDYYGYTQADFDEWVGGGYADATERLAYYCYAYPLLDEAELLF